MSKKSKRVAAARMGGRTTPPASRTVRHSGAQVYQNAKAQINHNAVRMVAGVLAALCLIGGVAVAVVSGSAYTTPVIVEMVLLGILAGASIFAVIKPDVVAGLVGRRR